MNSNFIEYTLELEFSEVILPYAVRATSNFVVEIYKNYDGTDLSDLIASSEESFISEENFEANSISTVSLTSY